VRQYIEVVGISSVEEAHCVVEHYHNARPIGSEIILRLGIVAKPNLVGVQRDEQITHAVCNQCLCWSDVDVCMHWYDQTGAPTDLMAVVTGTYAVAGFNLSHLQLDIPELPDPGLLGTAVHATRSNGLRVVLSLGCNQLLDNGYDSDEPDYGPLIERLSEYATDGYVDQLVIKPGWLGNKVNLRLLIQAVRELYPRWGVTIFDGLVLPTAIGEVRELAMEFGGVSVSAHHQLFACPGGPELSETRVLCFIQEGLRVLGT
jgi:hypothetical protein